MLIGFLILLFGHAFLGVVIYTNLKTVLHEVQAQNLIIAEVTKRLNSMYSDILILQEGIESIDDKMETRLDKFVKSKKTFDENRFMSLKEVFTQPGINERS